MKGLITEASPLTYPADASIGELNTVVSRKGNRTRRRGLRYEEGFVLNEIESTSGDEAVSEYVWHSVAKQEGKVVSVIQIGDKLHFWTVDEAPLSDNKLSYTIDLKEFRAPSANAGEIKREPARFSSGAGFLFVAHPLCDPIVVEHNLNTGNYTAIKVVIQVRDFDGVYDGLANDEEPLTLSPEHHYNLRNQGWVSPGEFVVPAVSDASVGLPGTNEGTTTDTGTYYDPYTGRPREYSSGSGYNKLQPADQQEL